MAAAAWPLEWLMHSKAMQLRQSHAGRINGEGPSTVATDENGKATLLIN
jgi:hypothetical protein